MTTPAPPSTLRRLDSPEAKELAALLAAFDELQTALRCCEKLIGEFAARPRDDATIEALWVCVLLSYRRCFGPLSAEDVAVAVTRKAEEAATEQSAPVAQAAADRGADEASRDQARQAMQWHESLLKLREHYVSETRNPRESFNVGVAQDGRGSAAGIGVSSTRQPRVDEVIVRQTGAIAYALSELVDARIATTQERVFDLVRDTDAHTLDTLPLIEVVSA